MALVGIYQQFSDGNVYNGLATKKMGRLPALLEVIQSPTKTQSGCGRSFFYPVVLQRDWQASKGPPPVVTFVISFLGLSVYQIVCHRFGTSVCRNACITQA